MLIDIGKAHQRIIREKKSKEESNSLFGNEDPKETNIKDYECKRISYKLAKLIILEYEWLGTMGTTQIHFGIFHKNILAGVICFGFFQALEGYSSFIGDEYSDKGIQLSRGACVHWAHPHCASKLIGYGLREVSKMGYKYVVAFSDPEAGEIGTVYQATNWHYVGYGKSKHFDIFDKRINKKVASSQDLYKKGTRWENFSTSTYDKNIYSLIEKPKKGVYIKLIGDRRENRKMMKTLKPKIVEYPKRKNFLM